MCFTSGHDYGIDLVVSRLNRNDAFIRRRKLCNLEYKPDRIDGSYLFKLLSFSPLRLTGRGGIRTHGTVARTSDFESDAFDHSATLPAWSPTLTRF